VIDDDWIIINEDTKKIIQIEEKIGEREVPYPEKLNMKIKKEALSDWCKKKGWEYCGYHIFRYLINGFLWDERKISEEELQQILSLGSSKTSNLGEWISDEKI